MPRSSSGLMTSTAAACNSTRSSSSSVPRQSVLSRSHTTHLMSGCLPAVLMNRSMLVMALTECACGRGPGTLLKGAIGNRDLLDLIAAFDDFHDLRIAQVALNGILTAATVRAMNLHGVSGSLHRCSSGKVFGDERVLPSRRVPCHFRCAGLNAKQSRGIYVDDHLGQHLLDE